MRGQRGTSEKICWKIAVSLCDAKGVDFVAESGAIWVEKETIGGDLLVTWSSKGQRQFHHALLHTFWARRIRHCREFSDAMNFNGRSILFVALGCGLIVVPAFSIHAQQATDPSLQARPASGQDQEPDPLKREKSD